MNSTPFFPGGRLLICTDLDRTLIPNGAAPESPQARPLFRRLAERDDVLLAYVSGRDERLVRAAIHDFSLPLPDFVIGDVGSTILAAGHGEWSRLGDWEATLDADWPGDTPRRLRRELGHLDRMWPQEDSKQGRHKLSYYIPAGEHLAALLDEIRAIGNAKGMRSKVIYSFDEPENIGLIDILPATAGKLNAIRFVVDWLNMPLSRTVFCGDSGNDLEVLVSDVPAVLVGNGDDDTRRAALSATQDGRHTLYLAAGDFVGMNGNYAAGILEGIAHYHAVVGDWLERLPESREDTK